MIVTMEYRRERAVEYARRWALSRNPLFENYTGIGGRLANGYGNTCRDMYVCNAIMFDRVISENEILQLH